MPLPESYHRVLIDAAAFEAKSPPTIPNLEHVHGRSQSVSDSEFYREALLNMQYSVKRLSGFSDRRPSHKTGNKRPIASYL